MALEEIEGLSINPEQPPGFSLRKVEGLIFSLDKKGYLI